MPETTRRLFSVAAILTKPERDGSLHIQHCHGYRIATDGEDAVVGRYVRKIMEEHPGYALNGRVSVMEITRSELEALNV